MKKNRSGKNLKRISILLAVISITSVITACGGEVDTERTVVENTDNSEPLREIPQDEAEPEQTAESGTEALLQYRNQLEFCDLSGTQFIYEEMETEGYHYFMTNG